MKPITYLLICCCSLVTPALLQQSDENEPMRGAAAAAGGSLEEESAGVVTTAMDLLQNIYKECVVDGSFSCVKPKVLAFLSASMSKEKIRLTRDLSIVRSSASFEPSDKSTFDEVNNISQLDEEKKEKLKLLALDRLDEFLYNHELRIRIPKEITAGRLPPFVPRILTKNLPEEIRIPLAAGSVVGDGNTSGRSKKFMKRVVMPFLLGLKFKATTVIPLVFAIIALKTWKAFTLGLLSIVLSGAMLIFKFTKPKVVSYELVHYPHPHPHPPLHAEPGHYDYHPASHHSRQFPSSPHHLAYRGHLSD